MWRAWDRYNSSGCAGKRGDLFRKRKKFGKLISTHQTVRQTQFCFSSLQPDLGYSYDASKQFQVFIAPLDQHYGLTSIRLETHSQRFTPQPITTKQRRRSQSNLLAPRQILGGQYHSHNLHLGGEDISLGHRLRVGPGLPAHGTNTPFCSDCHRRCFAPRRRNDVHFPFAMHRTTHR